MRNGARLFLVVVALVTTAHAESFNRRLAHGQALLNAGDIDEAITVFRDLQVDEPDSDTLQYDLGCAHYAKALQAARDNALSDAAASLQQAVTAFEEAGTTPDNTLRRNARYNKATALGQLAKQYVGAQDNEKTVDAFEQAITAFEDHLRRYPDHTEARTNLNNLRYEFKKYLQQTPPPQEQESPQGSQGKDSPSDQQDKQQDRPQGQNPQDRNQDDQQRQDKSGENQDQQQQQEQQKGENGQQDEAEQQEQQTGGETPQDEQGESQPQEMEQNSKNIEAILDSLQDTDEQQQREMRQQPRRKGINGKWW